MSESDEDNDVIEDDYDDNDDEIFKNYTVFHGPDVRMQELAVAGTIVGMLDDFEDWKKAEG